MMRHLTTRQKRVLIAAWDAGETLQAALMKPSFISDQLFARIMAQRLRRWTRRVAAAIEPPETYVTLLQRMGPDFDIAVARLRRTDMRAAWKMRAQWARCVSRAEGMVAPVKTG